MKEKIIKVKAKVADHINTEDLWGEPTNEELER